MIWGAIFNYNVKESERIEADKVNGTSIENITPPASIEKDRSAETQAVLSEMLPNKHVEVNPSDAIDESSMAHIQCKEFVKDRLKAPSSAEFTFLDFSASKLADSQYVIRSYVDAQNAFGAKLRNNYTCVVKWNGSDHSDIRNWELVSMQIDE